MRKLVIGITAATALLMVGAIAWNAEASSLTSSTTALHRTNYSLVEKAGCWLPGLPGECEIGQQQVCDRHGHCKCALCSGWYPWREYKPAH
jgi:hypothetical protein